MNIDITELEQVATQVWALIMGSEMVPSAWSRLPLEVAPTVAHVELTGAYSGKVALQIEETLIRSAAANMFGIDRDDVTPNEMADTARELANMVGGNIKCLVEQPTALGLPVITPADEFHAAHADATCKLSFEHEGAAVQVMVFPS